MNHQRLGITLLAILLICSQLFCLEKVDANINKRSIADGTFACNSLLTNSGFESGLSGWLTSGSAVTATSDAIEGSTAVEINNTGTAVGLWQDIPGAANEIYTLKVLAKKAGSAAPTVGIEFLDASGALIHSRYTNITSTNYQEYSFSLMTPNNTTTVRVACWNGQGLGKAFFDDICFEKFTVDPISCTNSVDFLSDRNAVYVIDNSGNNSDTKDYDYGNIKLCDNEDGTLSIRGYVIGGKDSDWHESNGVPCGLQDAWYIDLLLSDVQSWEEFQDNYVQREGCEANRADWDFWEVSGTYTGVGCNAGRTVTVLNAAQNYRVQVGWGGNSQSCDFGMSTWFDGVENGTISHSDMYFHIKEIDYETVRPPRRRNPGCQNNLLRNPGFEDTPTSSPPYWTVPTASTFSTTNNFKINGDFSANLYHNSAGTGQVYQEVTGIIPGNNYNLSFYAGTHQPNFSHTVKIEFYNSSNTLLETSEIIEVDKDIDGNNTLDPYNLSTIAPPNTSYLRVVGTADEDYLRLDEVCLTTDKNICDNSITNSDFNNGTTDWTFKTFGAARARAELGIDNTSQLSGPISALITIDNSLSEVGDIQLLHDNLSILSGEEYQVNFQAKATDNRPITVAIQKTSSPYTVYKNQTFNLTTNSESYSFSYTPNTDNFGDVELIFQLGGNKEEVYLDKIDYAVACGKEICDNGIDDDGDGTIDNPELCNRACNCQEVIYLNDIGLNEVHKFSIDRNTGTLSEIGTPWLSSGKINNPHGLGLDLNGRLYIGNINEFSSDGPIGEIYQVNCAGEVLNTNLFDTPENRLGYQLKSKDGILYTYNNKLNVVQAYELCSGNLIGNMNIGPSSISEIWGMYIDETENKWYLPSRQEGKLFSGSLDANRYTFPATYSGAEVFDISSPSSNANIKSLGITRDKDKNFYIIHNRIQGDGAIAYIRKYSPTGTILKTISDATDGLNTTNGKTGFWGARGLVYSKDTDHLYVSSFDNCITVFDTNLNELTNLNIGNPLNGVPKGLTIIKECCPTNPNISIDTTLCSSQINTSLYLQNLINCDGTICEGLWNTGSNNSGITYNACDNSITINSTSASGSFTLSSNNSGGNLQCGTFNITVNVSIQNCTEIENCSNGIDDDGDGFIDSFDPDCSCTAAGIPNIDFSKRPDGTPLTAGTIVSELWAPWGIHISTNDIDSFPPMIFDSSNPTGRDHDLGTPNEDFGGPGRGNGGSAGSIGENKVSLGNLMIISEDGDTTDPDDRGEGGTLIYSFDFPVNIASIEIIDVDEGIPGTVKAYSSNNALITQQSVQDYGNNSYQKIALNATNVSKLEIIVPTSFSVGTLLFCDIPEDCTNGIDDDGDGLVDEADPDCTNMSCPNIIIKGDPSICPNGSTELTTEVINTSGTCYLQWESSTDNSNWTVMPGATNSILSITNLTTPTYYRVAIFCDGTSLCDIEYSQQYFLDIKDCDEICDNGIDDDGDGLTDCEDDDCPTPNIGSVDFTDPTNCPALDNGTITITATSMNDLEYSIDGGTTFQSDGNFTDLVADVYNIVVRDEASQCEKVYDNNPVDLSAPACNEICDNNIDDDGDGQVDCNDGDCGKPVIDSVTPSNPNNCPALDNGTIVILASGDNLEYSIDNGISYQSTPNFENLTAASYIIKVRNTVTGCQETASTSLSNTSCTEDCTDGIDNNGDGQIDCEDEACGKPTIIDITPKDPDNCPLATNGTITIIASGANLVYSIDGGNNFQNARIFINLSPGSFNIVVKNNTTGCTATDTSPVIIAEPTCEEICDNGIDDDGDGLTDCEDGDCGNPSISDVVGSDPNNCPILDNGEITITATGANLEYSIDGGVSYQSGNKYINLSAGTYHIQVRNNATGCTTTYNNNPILLTDPTCEEECGNEIDDDGDGEIDFQDDDCGGVSGFPQVFVPASRWLCEGTDYVFEVPVPFPNFTYSWDFGIYGSQNSAVGPGPHTIQFISPNGTNAVFPRVIFTATTTTYAIRDTYDLQIRPTISIAGATPLSPSDCGATDGSVVIEVNRQTDACFQLSLDGGTTWEQENRVFFDNLSTGSYSVVARYCDESCVSEPSIVTLADPTTTTLLGNDNFGGICPQQTYTNTVISNDIIKNPNVIYSVVSTTTHGTLVMDTKGSFEYMTTEIYCGTDQFSYSVCDPENICCVTAIVTLDLEDKVDPVLQNVPADLTISCDEVVPLPPFITAYDNCPFISIDKNEVSTRGLDGCSLHDYTITRSWTATDLCNNSKTEEQVITIADITAPDIFRIYTLPNGKKLIAGVMENVYQEWKTIPFPIQFDQTPLVFTQVVTTEDITPVVTKIRNTSTSQFELKLQEEENGDQAHARESVAWIAIEPGTQTEEYLLETGTIDINNNWKTINFENNYTGAPNFFTSIQTVNETDPSVVRANNLGATGVSCKLLEEKSKDTEVLHELENMAYLAMGISGNITDEKGDIIGEVGRISIDHNRVPIIPKNKYYNPIIITQSLTNNGSDPIVQRINIENQSSFGIQLQEWEYLDGTHATEAVSYMIIEGSIPIDASIICTNGTDGLEIGKDIVVVDNCDPNVVLQYEEGKALSGASRQTIRTWYAEDICGNKTAYSQAINCQGMSLQLKAFLQGALVDNNNESIMRDDLRQKGLLPLEEPYSDSKTFTHVGLGGGEVVDPSLFEQTGDQAIVDWVFIELKNADNFEEVVATTSALIQRDGNVVNVDGSSIINFHDIPNGEYYVELRHRNHLSLETLYPYTFTPNNIPFIDFTNDFIPLRGNTTRVAVNGQLAAWSGDLNGDNLTVFQGPDNDVFHMFLQILLDELNQNTLSNFISQGYTNRDFNMDGTVIFQGPNNDRSVLLWNTIFNHPDNEQNQSNFIVSIAEIARDIDIGSCLIDNTLIFCDFDSDGILNGSDPDDDNDGVSDGNDIAPYNNQSDTDNDGISDNDETGNDGSYHRGTDTDPLSPCDPFQDNNICQGTDVDGDGFFSNYPLAHSKYDPNDQNSCEPNGIALGCSCPDDDGDGFILICDKNNDAEGGRTISIRVRDWQANQALGNECGPCLDETNTPSLPIFDNDNDGYFIGAQPADTDDNNPCIPNTNSFACQRIDKDLDGYFGNADPSNDSYDLDDNNACIPVPTILCYGIDHDGDTYYSNFPYDHPLADPNDNDSCIPDVEKCPIDQDGDGYFDNISPTDAQFDPNDEDNCVPNDANCGGCPTFQGATFICNNPGTSNEATIILEPSEDIANYANSYCGPCVQFSTINDGEWRDAATWKNGKIPPTNINGITVSINHLLSVSEDITIGSDGYLWIKDKGLSIKNASLFLAGGSFTAINAQIVIDKKVNIDQVTSKFYINKSTLLVKEDYLITNSGISYFEGACVTVKGDYNITHGIEVYENANLIVEQGNLTIGQNSTIVIKLSKIKVAGSFNTQGLLTGMETLPALTALSVGGDLINTGLWLCNIENQYCIGGKNEVPEIYLKGINNCGGIDVFFEEHECP